MKYLFTATAICVQLVCSAIDPTKGFIENKGQILDQNAIPNSSVKFLLPASGMNVLLKSNGFSYDTYKMNGVSENAFLESSPSKKAEVKSFNFHRVEIEFVGSNSIQLVTEGRSPDYLNYYGTSMPENGVTNIHSYKKVTYKNIYPNIDVEFVNDDTKPIEYNFILRPGAVLSNIKLKYTGANGILLENNKLNIKVAHGTLTEAIPVSYWKRSGKKEKIQFSLVQNNNEVVVGYEGYDKPITETLIIDPTPNLDWGTYYGYGLDDKSEAVCNDRLGNVFMGGGTYSSLNIATSGAFQTTNTNTSRKAGFLVKFDRAGVRQWGTFYCSGAEELIFHDIACDQNNNVFAIGETDNPTGMTTPGSHQSALSGTGDAFLVKFDGSGSRQWATYYGGVESTMSPKVETGKSVAVDTTGNVYITGVTTATANIATPGAFQTNFIGGPFGQDAYLVKFNNAGSRQWATYFGGSDLDFVSSVCVGRDQNVYVTGITESNDSIGTTGSHQQYFEPSVHDAYLIKFSSAGNRLWGTYYGGEGAEYINGIAADLFGNVVICGTTNSSTKITSPNGYQPALLGNSFVAKFKSNGVRQWGTYLGKLPVATTALGVSCDSLGNAYITGGTPHSTLVTTSGAYQENVMGPNDAFIVKYDSACILQFGTLYGGNDGEGAFDICTYSQNEIYITGITSSTTGIAAPWGHQTSVLNLSTPNYAAFLAKFSNTGAVGITEFTKNESDDFTIYPNPSNGEINIICKEKMTLTITNELGQIVHKGELDPGMLNKMQLNLKAGVYFINAESESKTIRKKLILCL